MALAMRGPQLADTPATAPKPGVAPSLRNGAATGPSSGVGICSPISRRCGRCR
jgi:hypothetical protein